VPNGALMFHSGGGHLLCWNGEEFNEQREGELLEQCGLSNDSYNYCNCCSTLMKLLPGSAARRPSPLYHKNAPAEIIIHSLSAATILPRAHTREGQVMHFASASTPHRCASLMKALSHGDVHQHSSSTTTHHRYPWLPP
jgi:hypothetical protein